MTQPDIPKFVLLPNGEIPMSIGDLALMDYPTQWTIDMWLAGIHRRATNVTLQRAGLSLRGVTASPIMRKQRREWKKDRLESFDNYLTGRGYCIPMYTATALLCFAVSHKLISTGQSVQFACYPADYDLSVGQWQVLGWQNAVSPHAGILRK